MRGSVRGIAVVQVFAAAAAAVAVLAGCGGDEGSARGAAGAYADALAAHDGAAACRLLVPSTANEIAQSASRPCPQAVLDEDLPDLGSINSTQVWGRSAIVRGRGDTVFLSRFGDGWRVMAAGCMPRAGKPYDCQIKGG